MSNLFISLLIVLCNNHHDCIQEDPYPIHIRMDQVEMYHSIEFRMCKGLDYQTDKGIKCEKPKTEGCFFVMKNGNEWKSEYGCPE